MKFTSLHIILLLLLLPVLASAQKVLSVEVNGTINPASADFIRKAIATAETKRSDALIIHLNTPGGLLESTRQIVSDILVAKVPVVVYVSPSGSRAGSAGVFITMAANIAAMAPGTNIGAAHPVSSQGSMDSVMSGKVTNDAAAFIRAIAEKRNRNMQWAEEAVRHSVSLSETEALRNKVIDLIAFDDKDLLAKIDGKTVEVSGATITLHTKNAVVATLQMQFSDKLLNLLSDPNIAYLLMMLGFYGLLFELYSPGAIFPGIVGGICLILAFYALHTLPVNYAGVALIVFAIILFLLEIKITSHGMLTIGGIVSLVLGSVILFNENTVTGFMKLSWVSILSVAAVSTLFFVFVLGMGLKAQRLQPVSGAEGLLGETGETLNALNPAGIIKIHGEVWKAESLSGPILQHQKVKVTRIQDLKLYVEVV